MIKYYLSNWIIRILAFCIIFVSVVIFISFFPFRYENLSQNLNISRLIAYIFNFAILILPIFIVESLAGNSFFKSFGLSNYFRFGKYLTISFFAVFFSFLLIATLNFLLGNFKLNLDSFAINTTLIVNLIIIFLIALQEELVFRGFLINSIELRFTSATAIVFSSLFFSLMHLLNANYSILSAINTFIAGLLLGLLYVQSRSIWLPVLFHFFWNALQPIFLNSAISGIKFEMNLFLIDNQKFPLLLNGGEYGFENTLSATIFLLMYIFFFSKIETLNPFNSSYQYKMRYQIENLKLRYGKNP